ncbi:MAG: DUF945 family protein [Gammaproteobacteria bacterium]
MRRLLSSVFLLIIIVIVLGPWASGRWLQQNYNHLISFYNSDGAIQVAITHYQRGWMSSDVTLTVDLQNTPELQDFLQALGAHQPLPTHYQFVVQQHIQHGPIIYQHTENLPTIFGLGAIQNKIEISPELKKLIATFGIQDFSVKSENNFVSLFGNFYHHVEFLNVRGSFPNSAIKISLGNAVMNLWVQPEKRKMDGSIALENFTLADTGDFLTVPKMNLTINQQLSEGGFWLGESLIKLPEMTLTETGGKSFFIKGFQSHGSSEEIAGQLEGVRTIDIDKIQLPELYAGPIHFQFSAHKLNASAIKGIVTVYQEFVQHGEVYQGQFRRKIIALVPKIVTSGSAIKIDKFDLNAPEGQLQLNAAVFWPDANFIPPENVPDLFKTANAELKVHISKSLMKDVIGYASGMPGAVREMSQPDRPVLLKARDQMTLAVKHNTLLINKWVAGHQITKAIGDELLLMQTNLLPEAQYSAKVSEFLREKQITQSVANQLDLQYAQIQLPYLFLLGKVDEYQQAIKKQMSTQLDDFVKQGFVKEENNKYLVLFKWFEGKLTVNGRRME